MPRHDDEPLYRTQFDRALFTRLLSLARPHRRILAGAVLLLIMVSAIELTFPYLMMIGVDKYIGHRNIHGLLRISGLYLGLLILLFFLRFAQMSLTQGLGQRIMFDLRRRLFGHVESLSISYFERNPVGRVMTRLTSDVEVLNDLFTSGLVSIFGDIVILLGIVGMMLYIDIRLALVCFLVLPPLLIATGVFRAKVRSSYTMIRVKVAAMNAFLQESLIGISLIQLFRAERASRNRFDGLNRQHRNAHLESVQAYAVYFPVVEFLEVAAIALILGYGGSRVLAGVLTIGSLLAFIQYSERFFRPIRDLSDRFNTLQGAMASSERIFELLDTQPEIYSSVSGRDRPPVAGEVVFDRVQFGYKKTEPVLRDMSFRLEPGESVALVGHTGAGKTTIASLLSRFYDPWAGKITIDGRDLRDMELPDLRRIVGIVPQDVFLFSGSAVRNVGLRNPAIGPERVRSAVEAVSASEFLDRLPDGFDTDLRERGNMLSVGQRQLIAFARVLAHDPRILILDEATSSVDTQTEMKIRLALRKLLAGRTSLVIAHRLSTIRNVDRILVLHKGRLVDEGTHEQLLSRGGIYSMLYQLEFREQEEDRLSAT